MTKQLLTGLALLMMSLNTAFAADTTSALMRVKITNHSLMPRAGRLVEVQVTREGQVIGEYTGGISDDGLAVASSEKIIAVISDDALSALKSSIETLTAS